MKIQIQPISLEGWKKMDILLLISFSIHFGRKLSFSTLCITSSDARALPRVLKFHFSMHILLHNSPEKKVITEKSKARKEKRKKGNDRARPEANPAQHLPRPSVHESHTHRLNQPVPSFNPQNPHCQHRP
jgi:hypothetical protein